jgi:hypothetical protein
VTPRLTPDEFNQLVATEASCLTLYAARLMLVGGYPLDQAAYEAGIDPIKADATVTRLLTGYAR